MADFIMTIEDDDDAVLDNDSSDDDNNDNNDDNDGSSDNGSDSESDSNEGSKNQKKKAKKKLKKKLKKKKQQEAVAKAERVSNRNQDAGEFADDFEFEDGLVNHHTLDIARLGFDTSQSLPSVQSRIDLLLERRQLPDASALLDDAETGNGNTNSNSSAASKSVLMAMPSKKKAKKSSTEHGDGDSEDSSDDDADNSDEDEELKAKFFAEKQELATDVSSFSKFKLCRPLLVGLHAMDITKPSPIQAATLPIALAGHDVCACAPTGSGKTAAFLLPTIERLYYKPKGSSLTRVLILSPTRELASQVCNVAQRLCDKIGHITVQLVTGGRTLASEKRELQDNPDIIVATPGRLVDHLMNTKGFGLQHIDILILDEADRLLEVSFTDTIKAIVDSCPIQRQSLLFSATMTDKVNDLVSLSLNRPHYIDLAVKKKATDNLVQEFIRIRPEHEDKREAIVLSLCKMMFTSNCLVFVRSKKHAHRLCIIFGLAGMKAGELHGSLTQVQRLESLNAFTAGKVDVLICSDLAGRGLDIPGVTTVINLNMPSTIKQYIHRVGRTARAGNAGRSISLVGDEERKLMRELYKANKDSMHNRTVKAAIVSKYKKFIDGLSADIKEILEQEAAEAELLKAEMEERRARNMIEHQDEILARPARQWIQTKKEREASEKLSKRAHEGDKSAMLASDRESKERRQMLIQRIEQMKAMRGGGKKKHKKAPLSSEHKEQLALAREVKRQKRPKKMTVHTEDSRGGPAKKKARPGKRGKDEFGFDIDLSSTSKRAKTTGGGLKKKLSSKKKLMKERSDKAKSKPKPQQGHAFKSKKRYKRR